jgi:hypothetical protein
MNILEIEANVEKLLTKQEVLIIKRDSLQKDLEIAFKKQKNCEEALEDGQVRRKNYKNKDIIDFEEYLTLMKAIETIKGYLIRDTATVNVLRARVLETEREIKNIDNTIQIFRKALSKNNVMDFDAR